jgi:DNA polymerase-3 subunit gamma/tau
VLKAESVEAEPQALRLLARAARGSMRDALSLTDQAIAFGNGQLQEASVRQMLGSVDRGHVFRLHRCAGPGRRQDRGRDLRGAASRRAVRRVARSRR